MHPSCRRLCRPVVRRRRQKDNCVVLVYVTLNTLEEGQRLAELLMARQLTNCVNFHPITCTYLWEGKITTEPEVVALIKTQARHFDAIATAVQETVPYTNRSEERRVGKECRSRWATDAEKINKQTTTQ